MEELFSFGGWLKRRRKALDLTQSDLASRIGCSLSTIVKIEADERRPSRQIAELLATILEIPPDQRAVFIRIARGERRSDTLPPLPVSQPQLPQVLSTGPPSNIPTPPSPLIGREAERQEIVRLLLDPSCRLLTLIGPGGIGKSRLAYEVGSDLAHRPDLPFPDGLYLIPLASVHSASYLVPAIAQSLGVTLSGATDLRSQISRALRECKMLLLIDNLEHLLEGVDVLVELLEQAPGIKLLTTSQVRLNLSGEWVFEIQGLPFPALEQETGLDTYSSVRLFLNYMRQARVSHEPDHEEYQTIAEICRLLEGLPLAIQLAAAWSRVLSPGEILEELEKATQAGGFPDILATPARDLPERHRSLQAAFDYSWKLLDEHERQHLRRLSVFEGGFQREAAEQVAGSSLSVLAALMDKSLLQRADKGRYSLHELVHQYGFVKLKEDLEEQQATLEKHCRYYGSLLQPYVYRLKGRSQAELQTLIAAEIDNFRQAWDWAIKNLRTQEIQLLGQGFSWFYELRGWYEEGLAVFRQAIASLSILESTPDRLETHERLSLASVIIGYGWFLNRHGSNSAAKGYFLRGLSLLRSGENAESLANVLHFIGMLDLQVGEYAEGRAYLQESLQISRAGPYTYGMALSYSHLGVIAYAEGKLQETLEHFEEALGLWEELMEPIGTAYCLRHLRQTVLNLDANSAQYLEADEKILQVLAISRAGDDSWGTGTTLNHLGILAILHGELQSAAGYFQEAAVLFQKIGDPYSLSQSCTSLGYALACQGLEQEARQAYVAGYTNASKAESMPFVLDALVGLAELCQPVKEPGLMLDLVSLVDAHPAAMMETRQRAEKLGRILDDRIQDEAQKARQIENRHYTLEEIARSLT